MEIGGVGLGVAFAAGVLSCLSPCLLPLVPSYIAYLMGTSAQGKPAAAMAPGGTAVAIRPVPITSGSPLGHALGFVSGFSLVFIAFGASLGLLGYFLRQHRDVVQKVAGSLLILLGLHLAGVITIPFLEQERRLGVDAARGYIRSFLVGASFAAGWSPCIGPTLGAILAVAVSGGSIMEAVLLLAAYSAGLAIPFLVMGLAFNALLPVYRWLKRAGGVINYVSGAMLVVVGILIFTGSLINLNSLFDWGPLSDLGSKL
jgi:cytochrome c-type biogenesis protein